MTTVLRRTVAPLMALAALSYLVAMVLSGALPERRHMIEFQANGVMQVDPATVTRVTVVGGDDEAVFERRADGWIAAGDGEHLDKVRALTLDRAVKFMHTAAPVREFALDELSETAISDFGLDRPSLSVTLENAEGVVLAAHFGDTSNDGILQYMQVEGADVVHMISRFVGEEWESVAEAAGS